MMLNRRHLLGCSLAAVVPLRSQAQAYPTRVIRWIVPVPAATAPDIIARALAEVISKDLGQSIVIDNIAGAGGNIGAAAAARAPADGYTWFLSTSPMANNMKMFKSPGYDALKDFTHVAHVADYDEVVVVPAASPHQTIGELVAAIKAQPGKLNYGSGGVGTPTHLVPALLLKAVGGDALHVPFKGGAQSMAAVMGAQVDFAAPVTNVGMAQVTSGKLRALAVSGRTRNPIAPNVPTLTESGIPVTLVSFSGVSVPAATPAPVAERIAQSLRVALDDPKILAVLQRLGLTVKFTGSREYTATVEKEIADATGLMRVAGLEAQ